MGRMIISSTNMLYRLRYCFTTIQNGNKKQGMFSSVVSKATRVSPYKYILPGSILVLGSYYLFAKTDQKDILSNSQTDAINIIINKQITSPSKPVPLTSQGKYELFLQRTNTKQYVQKITSVLIHILRFFQLLVIFTPTILFLPLRMFKRTRSYWMDTFVKAIERAGVVWIKSFQYLSHRRDIIGVEMADKFIHLREHAPQHTLAETKKYFKIIYNKEINQIFQEFDEQPIASGSVSQVYKAKYHGKKVAVKVRHPDVDKYITRDINLLFFFSRVLGFFSKSFTIPVTEDSMKRTLNEQINFINQRENLLIFNEQFKSRKDIQFPQPFQKDSNDAFLIQTFVQGVPITFFEENEHNLRPIIARLGAETFFDMLIKHNFIHADAHGGNLMISLKDKSITFFGEIWEYIKQQILVIQSKIIQNTIQSDLLKKLYKQGSQQAAQVRKMIRQANQYVILTVIDTGMVITLDQQDRKNFISYLQNILHGNSKQCAQTIYNLSNYDNKKIKQKQFPEYKKDLLKLFSVIDGKDLDNLPGLQLFSGLLSIIRNHRMKLQGQFATLLTNMLVLQGMAKQINPDIQILKIALPYFNLLSQKERIHEPNIQSTQ